MWFTADHHIGHRNIISFCGRPHMRWPDGPDVTWMGHDLRERHNDLVRPGDDVWILGDLALGHLDDTLPWFATLHGQLHIVVGNHDLPFRATGTPLQHEFDDYYQRLTGAVSIHHGSLPLDLNPTTSVTISHFPYTGDHVGTTDRYTSRRPEDTGGWLLHGHIHNAWRTRGRQINVGVDAWNGSPVNADTLLGLIDAGEQHLPPLAWSLPYNEN